MDFRRAAIVLFVAAFPPDCPAIDVDRPEVTAFIDGMVTRHNYDRQALEGIISTAELQPKILDAISRPAEKTLTWPEYRDIFLTGERIAAGAEFWRDNVAVIDRISAATGVEAQVLIGIIGVETYFGRITGNYRVLDALTTLAFDYPPRSRFFTRELEEFLLLVREEDMNATEPTGSYAGAMGRPQFMPSSYRAYAVDATQDGRRDIWNNWSDVIGSIANYFVAHGWIEDAEVASKADLAQGFEGPVPPNRLETDATIAALRQAGARFDTSMAGDHPARLVTFDLGDGEEYWVGFHNFFVITRYNRSEMYALAVHQLGNAIAREYKHGDSPAN